VAIKDRFGTEIRAEATNELVVDRIACDGFGMCAELLPELIELDDWGYPIVRAGGVPDELLDHARRAVAVCPVLALRLARRSPAPARRSVRP
jgi:ferredoxin